MLIVGGTVVDAAGTRRADLRTGPYGQIAAVAPGLVPEPGEEVIDADGLLVVPGGVDAHTHLHLQVGQVAVSDDFGSGTAAAAVGGTTTVIEYVTTRRGQPPAAALAAWRIQAEAAAVDYGFHMTLVDPPDDAVVAGCIEEGITSFKLYMAYPDTLQVDDQVIDQALALAGRHGGLITVHAENGPAITVLERRARAVDPHAVVEHALTRPPEVEGEATARAARLAEQRQAPLYVVHVSSGPALAAVRQAQDRGVSIMAETCPQYLYLDVDRLVGDDAENFVCTPPLRERQHAEELWHGMGGGWVHTVATDHCPFWMHDRRAGTAARADGWADFTEIPGGLPGIETRLALVWQGVAAGHLDAADWVRLCAEAPARTFGLWPRKGGLGVGADADVVVWDPARRQSLDADALHMRTDHSPYAGMVATGWPALVLSRGRVVSRDGRFTGEPGWGRYQPRDQVWFGA